MSDKQNCPPVTTANLGSHRVETAEDQRELEDEFGQRYAHIQTGAKGIGANRAQRRKRRYSKPDRG